MALAPTDGRRARRWSIGLLLGAGVLVNYLDRIGLSVALPQLKTDFALTPVQLGWLLSGFFWLYALLQIPVGLLLDRFGVTPVTRISTLLWGIASTATALVGGFGGLLIARLLLGAAEAPGFPANAKAVGYWFPRRERALATALFDAAAKFSNVVGVPLVGFVVFFAGWRWGFAFTGILSLLYFLAFFLVYRDPSRDPRLDPDEHRLIIAGGGVPEGASPGGGGRMLGYLFGSRKVWGLTLGFAAYGYSFYLFLTWLPNYLVQTMHMNILKSSGLAAIPWIGATIADIVVGGWLIDHLIERGHDETRVRKTVLVGGMLLGTAVLGATMTTDPFWAILWISIALAGLASAAPVSWSLPSLVAPRGGTATVGSIMNLSNNLMGAVAPVVTGYAVAATGSYGLAFGIAGVILLGGIAAFVLLLGRIEPIPDPPAG
ncbi:MFS transporter [Rhizosaccharibacter radicis]|uniref:MFS transporter n=1 Tax=Rhizosaccharibacter radicis TaxID=2782605 RepID=A0ABT1VVH5_9PROT|nr:MFS transporter [Acetobacteraceae bacterium KSS12]